MREPNRGYGNRGAAGCFHFPVVGQVVGGLRNERLFDTCLLFFFLFLFLFFYNELWVCTCVLC